MRNTKKIFEVGNNLLPAIAYGDSAGLAVETKSYHEIRQQYGLVKKLLDIDNPYFSKAKAGSWSDDTQLSLAIANSLINNRGFNIDSIADWHIKALNSTTNILVDGIKKPQGWGQSTWSSIERLKSRKFNPYNSGDKNRAGNGVLMKLAPLAFWQAVTPSIDDEEQTVILTRMTHDSDVAVVASLVHRQVLIHLFNNQIEPNDVLDLSVDLATQYENKYLGASDTISSLLKKASSYREINEKTFDILAPKGGFYSPETLVIAYGIFTNSHMFPDNVFKAVNLGGDSDSIASIIAAMSVMKFGTIDEPSDFYLINNRDELSNVGKNLADVAIKNLEDK